jgi:hypothetical protein
LKSEFASITFLEEQIVPNQVFHGFKDDLGRLTLPKPYIKIVVLP